MMWEYTDNLTDLPRKSISDLVFYNCGIEQCMPGQFYGPKRRDYHFIHFVLKGEGVLNVQGERYTVQADQIFIVPSGEVSLYQASEQAPWKYCWIGFLGIQSEQMLRTIMQCEPHRYVINCDSAAEYERRIAGLLAHEGNGISKHLRSNAMMYELMAALLDELQAADPAKFGVSIPFLARQYIELHYHDSIQISDVAAAIGIHVNYLSSVFQKTYGQSPKQYLTKLKIQKSSELLTRTNDPIYVVANSVGFADALAFSKFFRRNTGMSPTDYRKRGIDGKDM